MDDGGFAEAGAAVRIGIGALGLGPVLPPEPNDEESSERNAFGRPYPWYCGFPGGTLVSDECKPPGVAQINAEANAWLRAKAAEGKIDPALVEAGIKQSEAVVARDCAARPADCANLNAFAESPTCTTIFGAGFCGGFGGDLEFHSNTLMYAAIALVAVLGVTTFLGRER